MTHLSLVDPSTLLSVELRRALDDHPLPISAASALTSDPDRVGDLIDLARTAVRVTEFTPDALSRADIVVCGSTAFREAAPTINALAQLESPPTLLLLAQDAPADAGTTLVDRVNLHEVTSETLLSPHSAVILIAQVMNAVDRLGLETLDATALQAASQLGQEGMNEVFAQARSLLTFDGKVPNDVFEQQIAFSTALAGKGGSDRERLAQLDRVLYGAQSRVCLQTLQTGSFHGFGLSASLRFRKALTTEEFHSALETLGGGWLIHEADDHSSTIDSADDGDARLSYLLDANGRQAWLWIVCDNLVRASAANAVAVIDAWCARREPNTAQT